MAKIILEGEEFDNYVKIKKLLASKRSIIIGSGWNLQFIQVYGEAEAVEILFEENRNLRRFIDQRNNYILPFHV